MKNFTYKFKKKEDPNIIAWIEAQDNITDSIRYLIEQEILNEGIRNLQEYIPAVRKNKKIKVKYIEHKEKELSSISKNIEINNENLEEDNPSNDLLDIWGGF